MRITIIIFFASIFLLSACKNSSDPVKQNQQLTKEQADELYTGSQYIFVQVINFLTLQSKTAASGEVAYLPVGLGGSLVLFKPAANKNPIQAADSTGFGYEGNGCWTFNFISDEEGSSYGFDADVCFDTYGEDGKPTNETNTATIMIDLTSSYSYEGEGYANSSNLTENEDLTVSGVGGFLMGTGSLTVNGTETVESSYSYTYDNETESGNLNFNFTITDFVVSQQVLYPGGGTMAFTIITQEASTGSENVGYNIPGSATFNGTNIVAVKFAGFDYQLDLDLFF